MEFGEMERGVGDAVSEKDLLNLEETELRLGLPGTDESRHKKSRNSKRPFAESSDVSGSSKGSCVAPHHDEDHESAPAPKAQIVGWPPIRSYRKSTLQPKKAEAEGSGIYLKVSVDGAPYLRKIDLKVYGGYPELLKALENMFKLTIGDYSEREGYKGSEYAPTYEDKDGDWMLVGDVPWEMFMLSCKRLRIMKESEARGLGYGV
ncbi:auxin-induced protein 22B-like [Rhodamnia argentea]|uniref:Auxin-responsive protein n=1 Tax=Rhodamnia argentea TaxID=178133 RepID=A0A8B8Q3X7_9MYRT|nr:auxin-induced protein 22B-like [Rhodamnia argentea]